MFSRCSSDVLLLVEKLVLMGYGSNDDSVDCMTFIQQEKQNIFLIFEEAESYSVWF